MWSPSTFTAVEDRRCADPVHRMTNPDVERNAGFSASAGCPGTWRMRNSGGARAAHADWHRERNATGQIGIRSLCFSETKNTNELKKRRRLSSTGIYPPAHDPPPPPDMACVIHTHHSCVESIQHAPLLLHQNSASAKFLDNQQGGCRGLSTPVSAAERGPVRRTQALCLARSPPCCCCCWC